MRTGVWLVGARGSVAVTSIVGALALRAGLGRAGRLRHRAAGAAQPRAARPGDLVFGGHDIAATPLVKKAEALAAAGVLPAPAGRGARRRAGRGRGRSCARCRPARDQAATADAHRRRPRRLPRPARPRPGGRGQRRPPPSRRRRRTRRTPTSTRCGPRWRAGAAVLPPSSLYAYAAFTAGCLLRGLHARRPARGCPRWTSSPGAAGLPYAGPRRQDRRDAGQVGAGADVRACATCGCARWSGIEPARRRRRRQPRRPGAERGQGRQQAAGARGDARLRSRRATPASSTCDDIGDFKTAWDLITFTGFLGTPMRMEFTWHGCDSALAAPLVLDLARLTAAAHRGRARRPADRAGVLLQGPARRRAARAGRAVAAAVRASSAGLDRWRHASWRDLAELVRAPAALSVPGDVVAGAAAAGALGRAHRRARRAPRSASTGRAWPPTTGPTGSWTRSSARSGRSRPAGSRPAQALGVAAGLTAAGLAVAGAGRRSPGARRRGAAGRRGLGLRPARQEHRRPARRRWPPAAAWTCCSARRAGAAAPGGAGRADRRGAHLHGHRAVPARGARRRPRRCRPRRWPAPRPSRPRPPSRSPSAAAVPAVARVAARRGRRRLVRWPGTARAQAGCCAEPGARRRSGRPSAPASPRCPRCRARSTARGRRRRSPAPLVAAAAPLGRRLARRMAPT